MLGPYFAQKTTMPKQQTQTTNDSTMTAIQASITSEVTELIAGYHEARSRLAQIFSTLKLGGAAANTGRGASPAGTNSDDDWYISPEQLREVLDYVKSHNLLTKTDPPLIKVKKIDGKEYIDIDNLIIAMIIDSYISEGNYKTNYLQSIRRHPGFINENWYRVVDKLQWLLFKRLDADKVHVSFDK